MKNSENSLSYWIQLIIIAFSFVTISAQQTEIMYLSGNDAENTIDWEFYCTKGRKSGEWATVPVPSNWELHGFGNYNYGYDPADGRADEEGLYKYSFNLPENYKGKKINIVFEGSMTDTEVKINGKLAGVIHQGAFYRFKYDITNLLNYEGENTLEVKVSKISSNESVNKAERNADYWIFGGIYRPVYLEAFPSSYIETVKIDAQADGTFISEVYVFNSKKADEVKAQIYTLEGEKVGKELSAKLVGGLVKLQSKNTDIKQWTPEYPNLYKVSYSLLKKGKVLHSTEERIGFRTMEVREKDGVYLNGVKIKFKGVNRHSFYPTTGRALSKKMILEDVLLIKDMNMNAVRNSHYPADAYFYDLCDSLGIMVFDELGGWHDAYDTEVGEVLVREMITKSMNHPCVIMWINGNEGGHNRDLLSIYEKLDIQKRNVLQAWENFGFMDTQHYRDYNYGVGSAYQGHDIVMPTEFLHGMYDGGHGAGLEDFWKLMLDNPLSAGGLLWDFADEAIVRTDWNDSLDSDGNHGADGILGPFHEKEGSYYTIKEVWSPIYFQHKEITPAFEGFFILENRYHYTNTKDCGFSWELVKNPPLHTKMAPVKIQGTAESPTILPGEKDTFKIDLPNDWDEFDFLYITAINPQGDKIFTWSWPIKRPKDITTSLVGFEGKGKLSVAKKDTRLIVNTGDLEVSFDTITGMLAGVKQSGKNISFTNGPVLCEGESTFTELTYTDLTDSIIVNAHFDKESVYKTLQWTVYPSGWLKLEVVYSPTVERHDLMGITFSYPEENVKSIDWMGDGLYRVWKNRMRGNKLGVWHKEYNNTITGQTEYVYPEFKGFHSRMYWLTINTTERPFTVITPDEDLFFCMYTPGAPNDPYNTAPKFPAGDISFLQGITPMGTKCLQTYRMGPMSEENIYYTYGGNRPKQIVLYFKF